MAIGITYERGTWTEEIKMLRLENANFEIMLHVLVVTYFGYNWWSIYVYEIIVTVRSLK